MSLSKFLTAAVALGGSVCYGLSIYNTTPPQIENVLSGTNFTVNDILGYGVIKEKEKLIGAGELCEHNCSISYEGVILATKLEQKVKKLNHLTNNGVNSVLRVGGEINNSQFRRENCNYTYVGLPLPASYDSICRNGQFSDILRFLINNSGGLESAISFNGNDCGVDALSFNDGLLHQLGLSILSDTYTTTHQKKLSCLAIRKIQDYFTNLHYDITSISNDQMVIHGTTFSFVTKDGIPISEAIMRGEDPKNIYIKISINGKIIDTILFNTSDNTEIVAGVLYNNLEKNIVDKNTALIKTLLETNSIWIMQISGDKSSGLFSIGHSYTLDIPQYNGSGTIKLIDSKDDSVIGTKNSMIYCPEDILARIQGLVLKPNQNILHGNLKLTQ